MTDVEIGHNQSGGFVEDDSLSLSDRGYDFQFRFTEALLSRLDSFTTVTLRDMTGNVISKENFRRRGRDGGLDLLIRIQAQTPAAAKAVATKVRKIILEMEV